MNVQFEQLDKDYILSRESVAAETNVELLNEWLSNQRAIAEELKVMISSYNFSKTTPPHGVVAKLGFVNVSTVWLVKRLAALGGEEELLGCDRVYKKLRDQLTMANRAGEERNKKIAQLKARIVELEAAAGKALQ